MQIETTEQELKRVKKGNLILMLSCGCLGIALAWQIAANMSCS